MSQRQAFARGGTKRILPGAIPVAVASAALAAGAALAATDPGISISAQPNPVYYGSAGVTHISGRLSSGQRHVLVKLEQRDWPFSSHKFRGVNDKLTSKGGSYTFHKQPLLATQYLVLAPSTGAQSSAQTVYVMPGYDNLHCSITGNGKIYPCATNTMRSPGNYTLHFSFDYLYPGSAYEQEKGKPVLWYYGQRNGQQKPPSTLYLKGHVSQQERSGDRTHVSIDQSITIPSTAWYFQVTACTKTSEGSDGLGLKGPPGSHHCGDSSITYSQSQRPLG